MDDDTEKSINKPELTLPDDAILDESPANENNENSNGVYELELNEESNAFPPSIGDDESNSQSCPAIVPLPTFDCDDDAIDFQDTLTNDAESIEVPAVASDRSNTEDSIKLVSEPKIIADSDNCHTIEEQSTEFEIESQQVEDLNVEKEVIEDIAINEESHDEEIKLFNNHEEEIKEKENEEDLVETIGEEKVMGKEEEKIGAGIVIEEEMEGDQVIEKQEEKATLEEKIEDNTVIANAVVEEKKAQGIDVNMEVEEIKKKINHVVGQEEDTEVVSEDELPTVEKPRVQDAENVSDDELPGPKPAELPADTEVVSEDELPSTNKREDKAEAVTDSSTNGGRKRKTEDLSELSPVSDSDPSSKKQAVAKNGESKPVAVEKKPEEKEKKKKTLPELDKYWKVVNEDSSDFTGWTYLLQYVDQENDVEAAREAYDAFLSHYPYCYGYWRKYADYEKRKGSKKKCNEVLERGLKAIPLSVDLWIHYLNHIKSTKGEDITFIRQQYDRAIEACGLEFRSDRLWESYVKWEGEHGTPQHVTAVYDRLLATPTLGYTSHFDNFQEHVMSEKVSSLVTREELVRLRTEVREGSTAVPAMADLPPGEDEPEDHIASEEEGQAIKERIIAARRKVHKATGDQVTQRWTFEEGIKRPYFHVKPLERSQLKNWKNYLEWEKQHGSFRRALVLHERCLIACALYEEFWIRLVKFLEEASQTDSGLVSVEREALERACTVHHPDKPALHLHWAYFEEAHGNEAKAADILDKLDKTCPNLVQVAYRRVNLERRRGDYDKCAQLYQSYISSSKTKAAATSLSIKYAHFLQRARADHEGAQRVLGEAVAREPLAARLYLQQLDVALRTPGATYQQMAGYLEAYERVEGAELEVVAAMAARRLELAEEVGSATDARAAYGHQRALERRLSKRARQKHEAPPPPEQPAPKKKETTNTSAPPPSAAPLLPSAPPPNNMGPGSYYPPSGPPPPQTYDQQPPYQQQYQPQWNHYQQHPPGPYHHGPWGQYPNYY